MQSQNAHRSVAGRSLWNLTRAACRARPKLGLRRLGFEMLEDRRLLSISLPGLHLADPSVARFDGQIIYLNVDGQENVTYNGPVTVQNIDVPAFSAPGDLAGQEQAIVGQVLKRLDQTFGGTGVSFTTERPRVGLSYSTIYVGGRGTAFTGLGDVVGIAETIDVGNQILSDNAFVFAEEITNSSWGDAIAASIAHEAGHLLGYAHDESNSNPIENYLAVAPDATRTFTHPSEDNGTRYITLDADTYTFRTDADPNGYHWVEWYTTYSGGSPVETEHLYYYDDHNFTFSAGNTYWVRAEIYKSDFWGMSHRLLKLPVVSWEVTLP